MLTAKNIERQLNLFYCCGQKPNSLLLDIVANFFSLAIARCFLSLFEFGIVLKMFDEKSLIYTKSRDKKKHIAKIVYVMFC